MYTINNKLSNMYKNSTNKNNQKILIPRNNIKALYDKNLYWECFLKVTIDKSEQWNFMSPYKPASNLHPESL